MPTVIPAGLAPARRHKRFPLRRLVLGGIGLAIMVLAVIAFLSSEGFDFSWLAISQAIGGLNPIAAIALMAVLPLGGFSIVIVYLVVGARFGPLTGLPVVAGVTAFHLLASYWIARGVLRSPLERLLARRGHHLPLLLRNEHASVCLLVALVPGLPYFARNYLLALTDVRLPVYFWVCLPIHVARSYVAILLGDWTSNPGKSRLLILAAIYAVKLAVCAYIVWRLRRHRQLPPAHPGRAQPAPSRGFGREP